jgi:hypothetical protein
VIMHNRAEKDENLDIIADIRRFFDRSLSHCGARWNSKTPCYPGRRYRLRQD